MYIHVYQNMIHNCQKVWVDQFFINGWMDIMCYNHKVLVANSLWPHGLYPARLLCPWNSPSKNTGLSCHFLLLGISPIQGLSRHIKHLLYWQADSLPLCHLGSHEGFPLMSVTMNLKWDPLVCFSSWALCFMTGIGSMLDLPGVIVLSSEYNKVRKG